MNLTHLSDDELVENTRKLVRTEREVLTDILHHLLETERRRLFSKYRCESLHAYAVKEMNYTEDQAGRRISAMRLLKELPAIEAKIESGALTLSHLVRAQSMFRREKKAERPRTSSQKLELLSLIEKASIRDTDRTLEQMTYVPLPAKKTEPLSLDQFDDVLQAKLKRLLAVRSHTINPTDLHALINQLADLGLKHFDPIAKAERALLRSEKKRQKSEALNCEPKTCLTVPVQVRAAAPAASPTPTKVDAPRPATFKVNQRKTRYIVAATNHRLFLRDRGRCDNCGSTMRIQKDHNVAFARGGTNEIENLRLLCRSCNQRHAIETYGIEKMSTYLKDPHANYFTTRRRILRPEKTAPRRFSSLWSYRWVHL